MTRRWPLLAPLLAFALFVPAGDAAAAEIPDASCPGPPTRASYSALNGGAREAQTFRVLHTGKLTRAAVWVNNNGARADFQLQILAIDAVGTPVGAPLSAATIAAAAVPSGTTQLNAALSPALEVKAGQAYALVVTKAPKLFSSFSFPAVDGNCLGDTFYSNGPSEPWNLDVPGVDLLYQTFVEPDVVIEPGSRGGGGTADFDLVEKKGRLFARVPGPGKLIVNDAKKPAKTSRARKRHVPNFLKRTKSVAKKAGLVRLRVVLTKRAIRHILKKRKLRTLGRVTYKPKGGTPSTLVFRIRLKV